MSFKAFLKYSPPTCGLTPHCVPSDSHRGKFLVLMESTITLSLTDSPLGFLPRNFSEPQIAWVSPYHLSSIISYFASLVPWSQWPLQSLFRCRRVPPGSGLPAEAMGYAHNSHNQSIYPSKIRWAKASGNSKGWLLFPRWRIHEVVLFHIPPALFSLPIYGKYIYSSFIAKFLNPTGGEFLSKGHRLLVSKGGSDAESFQNALYKVTEHIPPAS